jgi:tetratricopeptide (TPR) repeat protein
VKEALGIFERIGHIGWQIQCSNDLAWLLFDDKQLDAAEEVASRAINLAPEKGDEVLACRLHRVLGNIHRSKGNRKQAIHRLETALRIASPFNWRDTQFRNHFDLAILFRDEGEFDDANAHTEHAKSHAVNDVYKLGRAMHMQASVWYRQLRFEEAKSQASRALEIYEKFGAANDAVACRELLQNIEQAM